MATVGTLAGGVAHEINNPLAAILINAQMLLSSGENRDSSDGESLRIIEEATKRCRIIVQKLMVYSRKPGEEIKIFKVNLSRVIRNVISFLSYQLQQENVEIINKVEEGGKANDYLVRGNQNELEQVITNMILNARDAIKQINNSGQIRVLLGREGQCATIKIGDNGVGMPEELISKVFDPFFTTKDIGKGLGLGLAISQAIVERHKGLITVQSKFRKGSIFTIQLPIIEVREESVIGMK